MNKIKEKQMTGANKAKAMIETAFKELADRLDELADTLPKDEDNPIGSDAYWIREAAGELDGLAEKVSENILLHGAVNETALEDRAFWRLRTKAITEERKKKEGKR